MILVTGGTGFVGQEIVQKLIALGYRVRLLVRDPKRANRFAQHPQVELVRGDALKPETLPAAMAGVQAVIHLIGIIAETSKVTFQDGHVEATRNVLVAARKAGVTRWIQMSACGTRKGAVSRYHITKWEAEELVRQSGLDWTIFRPSLIYGYDERDRLLNILRFALTWPILYSFPLLNGGKNRVQPVSVREVALCFVHALSKEASMGQTYDLVGPVPLTWREMIFKIAAALGRTALYQEIPVLLTLRVLLWLTVILLPVLALIGFHHNKLDLIDTEIALAFSAVLAVLAYRWKTLIISNVPGSLALFMSETFRSITPRSLQISEQLKMAIEDNIGDSRPASVGFGYAPENFDEGLAVILANGRRSAPRDVLATR